MDDNHHTAESSPVSSLAARIFVSFEQLSYLVLGLLLAFMVLVGIVRAALSLWSSFADFGDVASYIATIDRILFVLMVVEILHTVRDSVRSRVLVCEPFLIVGLIASIRRVLMITLEASQAGQPGRWNPNAQSLVTATMLELAVLGGLILVLVISIYLLRRSESAELTSEIEQRIHQALAKHPLERLADGYRLVHPGGVGAGTLRLLPVAPEGEGPRVLAIVEIAAEYRAPALQRFHDAGVQRLNALALHGAFGLQGDVLVQKAQLSLYSNEVSAPFMTWLALTVFGQQLPLGQSTALATASAAILEQQRAHHGMPRHWNQPLAADSLQATVASLHGRGLAASHNDKAVWAEVALSGTCPSRSIDPKAETALLQVTVGTPHPIAGAGYLASLSLPWPKLPADPAATCRRLNELEMGMPDFVPRLGAWGLHGPEDVPRYTCFIPCPEPFADLHTTMIWWQAVRAAWIRDDLWVAGEGIDFGKRARAPAAAPAPAA